MLNQSLQRHFTASPRITSELSQGDWCVGDAPAQWDVSFADRLVATLRRIFTRAPAAETLKMPTCGKALRRKAA